MRILRLCSVYEPPQQVDLDGHRWDPVGGMQFHTGQLTRALDRLGVEQTVVTAYVPGGPRFERPSERLRVHRLGWAFPLFRQLYSVPAAAVLARAGRHHDVLHVHLGEDLAVLPLGMACARLAGLPMVVTIHCSLRWTLAVTGVRSWVLRTLGGAFERLATHRAVAVLTLTEQLRNRLVADGVAPDRVAVIPSGFDPALFAAGHDDPLPHIPRPRVVYIGRLAEQKGVHTLVRASSALDEGAHVVIVGDGPQGEELRAAAAASADGRITFTGFVPHDTVAAILAHTDVLVLPSIYEEMGSILVEAMAAGTPIVATSVGGIPELLEHGRAGVLVPPRDPASLADAVNSVLRDPARAATLAEAGRSRAHALSWPVLAQQVLDVYASVVRGVD